MCEETEEQVWLHALSLPPPLTSQFAKLKIRFFSFSCSFPLIQTNESASPCCQLQSTFCFGASQKERWALCSQELWAAQVRNSLVWDLIFCASEKTQCCEFLKIRQLKSAWLCCFLFNKTPPAHTILVGSTASIQWAHTLSSEGLLHLPVLQSAVWRTQQNPNPVLRYPRPRANLRGWWG